MMIAVGSLTGLFPFAAAADEPRLNQIQVIGSHNSYHVAPAPAILELIASSSRRQAEGLDYTHPPLAEQFNRQGIRQIELDVFADPKGGLFAAPSLRKLAIKRGKDPGPDPNADGRLAQPGMKVLHVQDADFLSRAHTFVDALKQVRAWSAANPRHVPILILVELKEGAIFGLPTQPVKFGRAELDAVDAEILSVFDRSEILRPDRVRGQFDTLPEAIKARGWPLLEAVRGQVMFALDNEGPLRDRYIEEHPALEDRVMFVTADRPDAPEAAWFKINDPVKDFDRIQRLVRDGFLVRTRADADTRQSRTSDGSQRDKALASGAQFVSTDYAEPDRRFSDYQVRLAGGVVARANPVSGDRTWGSVDLESGESIDGLWHGSWGGGRGDHGVVFQPAEADLFVSGDHAELAGFPNTERLTGTISLNSGTKRMQITPAPQAAGQPAPKPVLFVYELKGDTLTMTRERSTVTLARERVAVDPLANAKVELVAATGIDDAGNLLVTQFVEVRAGRAGTEYYQPTTRALPIRQATVLLAQDAGLKKIAIDEARKQIRDPTAVVLAYRTDRGSPFPSMHQLWKYTGSPAPDGAAVARTLSRIVRPGTLVFVLPAPPNGPRP
jgi:hypothetical protein